MKAQRLSFFILAVLFLSFILSGCTVRSASFPVAKNGVLDASQWDFSKNGPMEVTGEWSFYWKQFVLNQQSGIPNTQQQADLILVPSVWNSKKINEEALPGEGYATYVVTIRFNPAEKNNMKALYIPTIFTSYRLYIDGKPAASAGTIGTNKRDVRPQGITNVVYFHPKNNQATLTFHISNFDHKKGGIWKIILLGNSDQVTKISERKLIFDAALSSCLLIVGIYHFALYLLRSKNKSPLYFGLFCVCIGIRSVISGRDVVLTKLLPDFSWYLALQMEYLAFYLGLPISAMFIHSLYPKDVPRLYIRLTQIIGIIFSSITLVTPSIFYSKVMVWFYPIALINIFYMFFLLFRTVLRKREFALLNASFAIFFLLTTVNDILYYSQIIKTGSLTPFGLLLFVLVQSFTISLTSSRAFTEVERISKQLKDLNNTLEEKVEERTQKLEQSLREMAMARTEMSLLTERNRIAGEIHDIVGHTLTTTIVQIEAGKRLINKDLSLAIEKLELSQELVRNGLNEIRRTVHMIKEDEHAFDLLRGLQELIRTTVKHAGVQIEYDISPLPELDLLKKKLLYHALQEGLTNGIRHGKSTHFSFHLKQEENSIVFLLLDNGKGCENLTYGFGLKTMTLRAEEINGTMSITSIPDKGCQLAISFPLQ